MVVQDLADETDVFMEFGHLSANTRQKIEEFRRRRKEAEEYNENSPIKPPKTRRTSIKDSVPELTSKEKSLRYHEVSFLIVKHFNKKLKYRTLNQLISRQLAQLKKKKMHFKIR